MQHFITVNLVKSKYKQALIVYNMKQGVCLYEKEKAKIEKRKQAFNSVLRWEQEVLYG